MKIFALMLVMVLLSNVCLAVTVTAQDNRDLQKPGVSQITFSGGTDSNSIYGTMKPICGVLTREVISGVVGIADTNFAVVVTDENGKIISSKYALSSASLPYSYATSELDFDGNSQPGIQICGQLSVRLVDINCPNEIQTITIDQVATAGHYHLSYDGQATSALDFNAVAATVKTALEALVGSGVTVSFPSSGHFGSQTVLTLTFPKTLGNMSALTMDITSLTGVTTATIAEVKAGGLDILPTVKFYYKEN